MSERRLFMVLVGGASFGAQHNIFSKVLYKFGSANNKLRYVGPTTCSEKSLLILP